MIKYMLHLNYGFDGEIEMCFDHRQDAMHAFNELPRIMQETQRGVTELEIAITGEGKIEATLKQTLAEADTNFIQRIG